MVMTTKMWKEDGLCYLCGKAVDRNGGDFPWVHRQCAREKDQPTIKRRGPNEELLNEYGVGEITKTDSGRKYLDQVRKKYEIDALQPTDPRFKEIYGKQLKEVAAIRKEQAEQAKREWARSPNAGAWKDKQRKMVLGEL